MNATGHSKQGWGQFPFPELELELTSIPIPELELELELKAMELEVELELQNRNWPQPWLQMINHYQYWFRQWLIMLSGNKLSLGHNELTLRRYDSYHQDVALKQILVIDIFISHCLQVKVTGSLW